MTAHTKGTLFQLAIVLFIIAVIATRGAVFHPAFYKDPAGYLSKQAEETAKEQAKLAVEAAKKAAKRKQEDFELFQHEMEEVRRECHKDMRGYTTFEQCVAETYIQTPPDYEPDDR